MITKDQVVGIVERVATVGATYAVAKGWITQGQVAEIISIVVALASVAYGIYSTRPTAMVQAAAALPQTTVITTQALAQATPESNIISTETNKVVAK